MVAFYTVGLESLKSGQWMALMVVVDRRDVKVRLSKGPMNPKTQLDVLACPIVQTTRFNFKRRADMEWMGIQIQPGSLIDQAFILRDKLDALENSQGQESKDGEK